MELCFEPIQHKIKETIEEYPYTISYYEKIAKELNCEITDLAALQLHIPTKDSNLDLCTLEWFFNQQHNEDKIKSIVVDKDLGSLVTNPEDKYETYMFGMFSNVITVTDIDGNKQKFVCELHADKISSIIYCSTKDTKIPAIYKVKIQLSCNKCGYKEDVIVNRDDLYHALYDVDKKFWKEYFPYLKPYQLEMLISQTCNECWNKMFPKDE